MTIEYESPRDVIRYRIAEQGGRLELNIQRLRKASYVLRQMSLDKRAEVVEIGKAFFENGRLITDDEWLQAMREVGIPDEKVLEIWDKKDELRREDHSPFE